LGKKDLLQENVGEKGIYGIKFKWFQMKICYRVLVMSSALKQMGVNKNGTCSFYQLEKKPYSTI